MPAISKPPGPKATKRLALSDPKAEHRHGAAIFGLVEYEGRVAAPNQKMEDAWSMPFNLEPLELPWRVWRRYGREYRRLLKQVEDWSESSEIRHLPQDVHPAQW